VGSLSGGSGPLSAPSPSAGGQYTAIRYTNRLLDTRALASIGSAEDSFDNALAESVIGRMRPPRRTLAQRRRS
jgi:hypothetical protein